MTKKHYGIVDWVDFDKNDITVSVTEGDTATYYYYGCCPQSRLNFEIKKGMEVEFTLYTNLYTSQIDTIKPKEER